MTLLAAQLTVSNIKNKNISHLHLLHKRNSIKSISIRQSQSIQYLITILFEINQTIFTKLTNVIRVIATQLDKIKYKIKYITKDIKILI